MTAAGESKATICEKLQLGNAVMTKWRKQKAFRDLIDSIHEQAVDVTTAKLMVATVQAIDTLIELLSKEQPASVRLGASNSILDRAYKKLTDNEMRQKVERLEALAYATNRTNTDRAVGGDIHHSVANRDVVASGAEGTDSSECGEVPEQPT